MKERPILFNSEMVRAILAGRKTQTRRIVKPQWSSNVTDISEVPAVDPVLGCAVSGHSGIWEDEHSMDEVRICPYGQPGDRLWVRETFATLRETCGYEVEEYDHFEWESDLYGEAKDCLLKECPRGGHRAVLCYAADGYDENPCVLYPTIGLTGKVLRSAEARWTPSIHMPRWASRITLEVTAVRVERLQDISEADAIAEGIEQSVIVSGGRPERPTWRDYALETYDSFEWFNDPRKSYRTLWESINGPGSWETNPWVWVVEFKRVEEGKR